MTEDSRYSRFSKERKEEYIKRNKVRVDNARADSKVIPLCFSLDYITYNEFNDIYEELKEKGKVKTKVSLFRKLIKQAKKGVF